MKPSAIKSAMLSLFLLAGVSIGSAATVTVGPSGQYPTPCAAFSHLSDGDTVQVDANGGIPYNDSTDCNINNNYLTIVGVNGRPVMTGANFYTSKGLWIVNGHDIVIDNFEFGNASGEQNAAGLRIQIDNGGSGGSNGGNITLQHSYVHDNGTGILGANSDGVTNWYSANPYITFQYDEFAYNGNHDGQGNTHNMYMGYGGNMNFTLQYSWSHDSYVGHTLKTRAPYNNILYDMLTDAGGQSSYLLDFCLGGSDYVVGNSLWKASVQNGNANQNWMIYRDVYEDTDGGDYPPVHQDLHFINNTVVDDPSNGYPSQFVSIACGNSDASTCPAPNGGGAVQTVAAVIENNLFIGPAGNAVTNQSSAYVRNNVVLTNTPSTLAANLVDYANYDFHLVSGSPAVGAGLYPPTDNTGTSDPNALAKYEFVMPASVVARPTPSGSTMDVGAYSYPRVGSIPSPSLSYTQSVTAPGSGTITISGLSTPPSGSYNTAAFVSENTAAVPNPSSVTSTTGTLMATFTVNPAVTQSTVVPIDIYVQNAHLVANVTVNPGPPVLSSVTQDYNYAPFASVHLEGPAPAGGTVITLSSSDPTYLYVPSSVTVPQGQISAETGSETGSLWGQNPGAPTETITATQGSITKTASFAVFAPGFHSTETEYNSVTGGTPLAWCVTMVGYFPNSGGTIQVTSDQPSIIPNQTFTSGYGGCNGNFQGQTVNFTGGVNFNGDVAINTSAVTVATTVNVTVLLNGASSGATAITVVPAPAAPGPPSNLSASASGPMPVNLSWTASPTSGITYNVYRSTTSGFSPALANQVGSGISGTTFSDYSLLPSKTYYYVVEANNSGSMSSPTNQASAATGAGVASGTDVLDINAGGAAASPYVADVDFSGGSTDSVSQAIDTSLVTNPAPQAVYQSERWGAFTYTIPNLTPNGSYVVRLQFAEDWDTNPGDRVFNVLINNATVLSNFDIIATAGATNKAVALNFAATADSNGNVTIATTQGPSDSPKINGIQIQSTGSSGGGADLVAIDAGGGAAGSYVADEDVSGGSTASFTQSVDTSLDTDPAPQAVYQTERWGVFTYTVPNLTAGANYNVLLHFAEMYYTSTGQRVFNVAINGTAVLSNFDIVAAAGGPNKAIVKTFAATANSSGQIVIAFTDGPADHAKLSGLEIQAGSGGGTATLPSGIILNGNAAQPSSSDLRLTDGGGNEASSAWAPTPVNVQSFTNDFTLQLTNANADGFAFVIQNNGTNALGAGGGGLGYSGMGSSVAVKFDLYNNNGEGTDSTGIYLNGASPDVPATDLSSTGINLHSGDVFKVHMTYDGTTLSVTETDQTTNATATQNYTVNIPSTVGGNTAYVGFTAGTGGLTATQDILAWSYAVNAPPAATLQAPTMDGPYAAATSVHIASAVSTPIVINLSTSDPSILYTPATVTIPAGQTSAETGTLLGSLWGQSPGSKTATLTATYGGQTQTLTYAFETPFIHSFGCDSCSATGGSTTNFTFEGGYAPVGGAPINITSDNPAVIPNQTWTLPAGQGGYVGVPVNTNPVSTTTTVNVTMSFNGQAYWTSSAVTVNP